MTNCSELRLFRTLDQLIQHGRTHTAKRPVPRRNQPEYRDFILPLPKPRSRKIESLLRSEIPETAERMPVDPDHALAPSAHIQKRIARFV